MFLQADKDKDGLVSGALIASFLFLQRFDVLYFKFEWFTLLWIFVLFL